ncbi:hypothetical protein AB0K23_16635 [Streptomyces sp. NPDC049602]|uniref:hypothetical protein n=1 Tax=Streptomyces sp. NPDC049602 TaxID=3155504 RepID=UPI0034131123
MTTDLPHIHPADDDIEPTTEPAPGPSRQSVVSPPPSPPLSSSSPPSLSPSAPSFPSPPPSLGVPPVPGRPAVSPAVPADAEPRTAPESPAADESGNGSGDESSDKSGDEIGDGSGDEAVHTLLRTAATERPVEEVAALVARLQETGELSSPADVALRAAAVTRPLGEVRELLALLNASGYDLHQAETTLRAAAVGRSVEDVVQLVGILGADSSDWRPTAGGGEARKAGSGREGRARVGGDAAPAATTRKRARGAATRQRSALDGALASGPGSHSASPALGSVLRWPAALALFVCGLIHMPTDLAGLRSGGDAQTLSVVVTVLCLACAVWLAARDTLIVWAASAGLAVVVIALHGVASARGGDLLGSSLGTTYAWAKALALLGAVGIVVLAGSALVRHARAAASADSA